MSADDFTIFSLEANRNFVYILFSRTRQAKNLKHIQKVLN